MRRLALLVLVASCAPSAHWPDRGGYLCVQNPTRDRVQFVQQDAYGRTLPFSLPANPDERRCSRWAFIADRGRFGYVDQRGDTTWSAYFNPWATK
jgi:hypothetical protein